MGAKMNMVKDEVIEAIRKLPDNCSVDDIMYEVYFITQVIEGVKEADTGKLIDHEKIKSDVKSW